LYKKTLSILEAATVLGIGRSAAYEAARTGQIPTIRIGRRLLVLVLALDRLLEDAGRRVGVNIPSPSVGAEGTGRALTNSLSTLRSTGSDPESQEAA
jgi:excisionase family DNA binding protein